MTANPGHAAATAAPAAVPAGTPAPADPTMGVGAAAAPVATPAPRGTTATGGLYQHLDYRLPGYPSSAAFTAPAATPITPSSGGGALGSSFLQWGRDGSGSSNVRAENVTRSWLEEYNLGSIRMQGMAYRTIPEQYLANSYPLN